jgi:hypothetical protein
MACELFEARLQRIEFIGKRSLLHHANSVVRMDAIPGTILKAINQR